MTDKVETTPAQIENAGEPVLSRPQDVPEKFWDHEKAELRADTLLQSYVELEKRLGNSLPLPSGEDPEAFERLYSALGRPDSPDGYVFDDSLTEIEPDPELNAQLHAAGFSQAQANLVYKLAAEKLQPLMTEMQSEVSAVEERLRLEQHFGGPERLRQVSNDLKTWGEQRLGEEAFHALTSTFDGVLALHSMMQSSEPEMVGNTSEASTNLNQEQLNAMMADPRYWRDRDPAFVERVTSGFSQLYAD